MRANYSHALPILPLLVAVLAQGAEPGTNPSTQPSSESLPWKVESVLARDDFGKDLSGWISELEKGGTVQARDGAMEIDVPAGCTVWLKQRLDGPVMIEYEATVLRAGGANDRVSDLNCFWMARFP